MTGGLPLAGGTLSQPPGRCSPLLHNCARCIESLNVSGCWITFTGNRNDKGPHKRASEGLADVDASLTCGSGDIAALRPF